MGCFDTFTRCNRLGDSQHRSCACKCWTNPFCTATKNEFPIERVVTWLYLAAGLMRFSCSDSWAYFSNNPCQENRVKGPCLLAPHMGIQNSNFSRPPTLWNKKTMRTCEKTTQSAHFWLHRYLRNQTIS